MLHPFSVELYRMFSWELTNYTYKYEFLPTDIGVNKRNNPGPLRVAT